MTSTRALGITTPGMARLGTTTLGTTTLGTTTLGTTTLDTMPDTSTRCTRVTAAMRDMALTVAGPG